MRKYFFVILIFLNSALFSQISHPISKVIINYNKGSSLSQSSGVYGIAEIIEFSQVENNFLLTKFEQIRQYFDKDKQMYSEDTAFIKVQNQISSSAINELYYELNTQKNNFNIEFIFPKLKKITRHEIDRIINIHQIKKVSKSTIKKIKRYDLKDSFVSVIKPDLNNYLIVSEVWNSATIILIRDKDTIRFKNQFLQILGQPFTNIINDKIILTVNLDINTKLYSILPNNSILKKQLDFDVLKDEYVKWYLKGKINKK